ncbi:MAG TPA: transporter substrate-binding domain-containing protein [Bordetella sp.]
MMFASKMKRSLACAAAAVCAWSMLAGSAAAAPVPTQEPGMLKVAMAATYPPFEYFDGDKIVGSDVDFGHILARHLGTDVSFQDAKFATLIMGLNAHHYDVVISGMYMTPERLAQARAVPYARTSSAILATAASGLAPKQPEDLCGLRVGIVTGTVYLPKLHDLSESYCKKNGKGDINISEYASTAEAFQAMLSNNVQVGMQVANTAHALADKSQGRVVVTSTDIIYPQTIGIYVEKDNAALFDVVSKTMAEVVKTPEYAEMLKKSSLFPPEQ